MAEAPVPKKTIRVTVENIEDAVKNGMPITCKECGLSEPDVTFEPRRKTCRPCRAAQARARSKTYKALGKCAQCGDTALESLSRCEACQSDHRIRGEKIVSRRKRSGKCVLCDVALDDKRRQFCAECAQHRNDWRFDQRQKVKREMIEHYGGKCECCDESILKLLTIDHIKGGGNKHRKALGIHGGGFEFYRWLIRNNKPDGFRVLCWSCNIGAHLNGGVCPHLSERVETNVR